MEDILKRINELARKQKIETLSLEEKEEQEILRKTYLIMFRSSFKHILMHAKVIDPLGNDVTPNKLKMEQSIYRLRKMRG